MEDAREAASPEVITFSVGISVIQIWPKRRYLQTSFRDGTVVRACPEDADSYRETARALGYGCDTWRMCVEHEVFHSLLALAHGRVVSPALWAVAHQTEQDDPALIATEEAEVLDFQRKLNQCRSQS